MVAVLHVDGNPINIFHQLPFLLIGHADGRSDQSLHETFRLYLLPLETAEVGTPRRRIGTESLGLGRCMGDVAHVALISPATDTQAGILLLQSLGEIAHAHGATQRRGRAGIDHCTVGKYRRK